MQPDDSTPDASPALDAATADATPGADTSLEGAVVGTAVVTYRSAAGAEDVPAYVGSPAALGENRDGSFTTYPGIDRGEGRFAIPEAPDGELYVTLNDRDYVHTEARDLDLGHDAWGPRDTSYVRTSVELDVDGLDPWQPADELHVNAPNAGVPSFGITRDLDPEPSYLDDALQATWDYFDPAVDADRGDRAYLVQERLELIDGVAVRRAVSALEPSDLRIVEDDEALIEGTLAPVTAELDLVVDWRLSEFEALATDMLPGDPDPRCEVELAAIPGEPGRDDQLGQPAPARLNDDCDAGDIELETAYGDPYPGDWNRYAKVELRAALSTGLDEASWSRSATLIQDMSLEDLADGPVQPELSPVRFLRVDGAEASVPLDDVAQTPVVTWNEPRLGEADGYEVTVYRLDASPGYVREDRTATIITTALRIRIPPGAMEPGDAYVIEVAVLREPDIDLATAPYREGFPAARAERATAVLRP